MEIRRATREDAESLSALNVEVQMLHALAQPGIFKVPEGDTFAVQFMQERLEQPGHYFFIAGLEGVDIGYVYARLVDRPENPYTYAWKNLYIDQICVREDYRRIGCGERLMAAVSALAREMGIDTILLDTWEFNQAALSFFKKQGLETFNERLWIRLTSRAG